jgi:hypothetical protein
MKYSKLVLVIMLLFTVHLAICQTTEEKIKNKFSEYMTPRLDGRNLKMTVFSGDLNGDGQKDYLISYCVEATDKDKDAGGGNAMMNLTCMLDGIAVYIKSGTDYSLKAEKSMDNFKIYTEDEVSFDVVGIEKGNILCQSTAYGKDDPRCCPSIKKSVYVKYENGKLLKQ